MKKKRLIPLVIVVILILAGMIYMRFQSAHTFTLSDEYKSEGVKSEQIQPVYGTVRVSDDTDTDVTFTDIESGKTYMIGYITNGMSEKIKLEKGKWYTVKARGNITLKPVNVRISESS